MVKQKKSSLVKYIPFAIGLVLLMALGLLWLKPPGRVLKNTEIKNDTVYAKKPVRTDPVGDSLNDSFVGHCDSFVEHYDKIIYHDDTLKFIFRRSPGSNVIRTGIFSYLQREYPYWAPDKMAALTKKAASFLKQGDRVQAEKLYNKTINYFRYKTGDDLKDYSDYGETMDYRINAALLCADAFDHFGQTDSALAVLKPWLANYQTYEGRIQEYYIKMCIKKYGRARVRKELKSCCRTIKLGSEQYVRPSGWYVKIFDAYVGLEKSDSNEKNVSMARANRFLMESRFYQLVK